MEWIHPIPRGTGRPCGSPLAALHFDFTALSKEQVQLRMKLSLYIYLDISERNLKSMILSDYQINGYLHTMIVDLSLLVFNTTWYLEDHTLVTSHLAVQGVEYAGGQRIKHPSSLRIEDN